MDPLSLRDRLPLKFLTPPRSLLRFRYGDGPRSGSVVLDRRKVYVLPTRYGLFFGLLLMAMLLGAVNYANNLGMLFVFLLAGSGVACILHACRNLSGLGFSAGRSAPVFAGDEARFPVLIHNPDREPRCSVRLNPARENGRSEITDLAAGTNAVSLRCDAEGRGRLRLGRLVVDSRFPMGLFRTWAHVDLEELECVVYPRPAPRLSRAGAFDQDGDGEGTLPGGEDFSNLRSYQPGDPSRWVHWKASAKREDLVVKEFRGAAPRNLWFTWKSLEGMEEERRLSQLCRWVLDAHAGGREWGLILPDVELGPGRGPEHLRRCLTALADYPVPSHPPSAAEREGSR